MNIPSLETILADLDEARRQRNASNRRIEELIDALETQQRVIKQAHEDIAKLTTERDELKAQWAYYQDFCKSHNAKGITDLVVQRDAALAENAAYYQLAKKEVWAVAESALREAKEALENGKIYQQDTGSHYDLFIRTQRALTTINKVLGDE